MIFLEYIFYSLDFPGSVYLQYSLELAQHKMASIETALRDQIFEMLPTFSRTP